MAQYGFVVFLGLLASCWALNPSVSEPKGYARLDAWKNATLYRVEVDGDYENNPLLIHLTGCRYGRWAWLEAAAS